MVVREGHQLRRSHGDRGHVGEEDGDFCIKLEDQVLITEDGHENLTSYPFDARLMGADCVLLIAAALEPAELAALHALALDVGLDALPALVASPEVTEITGDEILAPALDESVPLVEADRERLEQVLTNLIGNAIKFTEQGEVTVKVSKQLSVISDQGPDGGRQKAEGRGQKMLQFEVEDSGPGIASEEIEALFEPFSQTRSGRRAQEGTGLGLTISQKFVKLMGGDISVTSIVGQGSVFSFNIPVTEAKMTDIQQVRPERRVVALAPGQNPFRILVVDDVEDNRVLMVKLLEAVGFTTREAENGQEAIQVWEAWEPHLIWMDMAMPVMDGFVATRRIRDLESGLRNEEESKTQSPEFKIKNSKLKTKN